MTEEQGQVVGSIAQALEQLHTTAAIHVDLQNKVQQIKGWLSENDDTETA